MLEALVGEEERAISVITVSELLHGVHRSTGARRTRRRAFVEHVSLRRSRRCRSRRRSRECTQRPRLISVAAG